MLAPRIRQTHRCDIRADAQLPKSWKCRPILVQSRTSKLPGSVTVPPLTMSPVGQSKATRSNLQECCGHGQFVITRPMLPLTGSTGWGAWRFGSCRTTSTRSSHRSQGGCLVSTANPDGTANFAVERTSKMTGSCTRHDDEVYRIRCQLCALAGTNGEGVAAPPLSFGK